MHDLTYVSSGYSTILMMLPAISLHLKFVLTVTLNDVRNKLLKLRKTVDYHVEFLIFPRYDGRGNFQNLEIKLEYISI